MSTPHTDGQRVKLPAASIRTDRGTQSRHKTDPATIKEYAALMRDGVEFDPVTVYFTPEGEYVLSRGFHRLPAAIDAGRGDIDAVIRIGTLADAKWDSAGSNKHGLRCTAEDYRAAVALALSVKPKASDREIAAHLGVSHPTVAKYRPESTGNALPVARTGKDGKERRLPAKPPAQDKPKAPPVRVVRDADDSPGDESQEAPEDSEPVRQVETGYQPLFGGGLGEALAGKPAPEPRPAWDSLEAVLDRIKAMVIEVIARFPDKRGKVVGWLRDLAGNLEG